MRIFLFKRQDESEKINLLDSSKSFLVVSNILGIYLGVYFGILAISIIRSIIIPIGYITEGCNIIWFMATIFTIAMVKRANISGINFAAQLTLILAIIEVLVRLRFASGMIAHLNKVLLDMELLEAVSEVLLRKVSKISFYVILVVTILMKLVLRYFLKRYASLLMGYQDNFAKAIV